MKRINNMKKTMMAQDDLFINNGVNINKRPFFKRTKKKKIVLNTSFAFQPSLNYFFNASHYDNAF